ncbi:MAG: hypothetical protein AAB725_02020 [Patescibacteria group bacterium]
MRSFLGKKIVHLLVFSTVFSVVGYILFLSLATSLDFKIEALTQKRTVSVEEREGLLNKVIAAQGREALAAASLGLNLVEATLADGYVDIRPQVTAAADLLANNKQ